MSFVSIVVPLILFLFFFPFLTNTRFGHFSDPIDCGNLSCVLSLANP